jgi:hypothetical protein
MRPTVAQYNKTDVVVYTDNAADYHSHCPSLAARPFRALTVDSWTTSSALIRAETLSRLPGERSAPADLLVEVADGKVAGIAVNTGAWVAAHAEAGEVLVSSTVKDLVAGSGLSS